MNTIQNSPETGKIRLSAIEIDVKIARLPSTIWHTNKAKQTPSKTFVKSVNLFLSTLENTLDPTQLPPLSHLALRPPISCLIGPWLVIKVIEKFDKHRERFAAELLRGLKYPLALLCLLIYCLSSFRASLFRRKDGCSLDTYYIYSPCTLLPRTWCFWKNLFGNQATHLRCHQASADAESEFKPTFWS